MLNDLAKEKLTLLLCRTFVRNKFTEEELTEEFWTELRIQGNDFFLTEDGYFDLNFFWSEDVREWILADKKAWINEHNLGDEVKKAQRERMCENMKEHLNKLKTDEAYRKECEEYRKRLNTHQLRGDIMRIF